MLRTVAVAATLVAALIAVPSASAQDTTAPVLPAGAFSAPPNGNGNWRLTAPQTLNLSATDDVAVAKFQYSLDGGATYVDVAGHGRVRRRRRTCTLSQESNTTLRYRAVDSAGNISRGATTNTTLNQASAAGATAVRLASTTGRSAGDTLVIDTGAAQETATIATIVDAGARRAGAQRDADRAAGQRARRDAAVAGTATYLHDPAADRHQGADRDLGHAGDDAAARGRRGREPRGPARERRRAAPPATRSSSTRAPNAETVKIASIVDPRRRHRTRTSC